MRFIVYAVYFALAMAVATCRADETAQAPAAKPDSTKRLGPAALPIPLPKGVGAPAPGHSQHGEAFDDGPRQRAYLMPGTGRVHLPVTSSASDVQAMFDQGVGQLHGFWYFEAERTFRQVAMLDADCAMAYWGMAMANVNNEKRAKKFIENAVATKAKASPREQLWIDALATYYAPGDKENKTRRRELVRALEQIVQDYPDEIEAKAFLALQIWMNADKGLPISSHQVVDALLSQVFAVEPLHPAHHYQIHLWDKEKPGRALQSAARCGGSAPTIAHMWHMPGHIYDGLHRYADAAWQQEASARVDHAHMIHDRILPDQIHNYAHNNEWLIRDMVNVGRVREAVALAKNMIELPRHPQYNVLTKASSSQHGRNRLLDVLARCELWDELIALSGTPYLEPTDIPEEQIKRLRALGAAQAATGNAAGAEAQAADLADRLAKRRAEQDAAGLEAENKAREEKKPDDQVARAKEEAIKKHADAIKKLEAAVAEIAGRLALARGDLAAAKCELEKAEDIDKGLLASVTLSSGDAARAEEIARKAVESAPGQALPLAHYADILWRAGKTAEAKAEFEKLRALSARFDLQTPVFQRLAPIAKDLGLADDWRVPATTAADFGQRPALDSLGPLHWHPAPAETWALAGADQKIVSLRDYAGRPVIVVFYLGFGCLHCVEQLKALEPMVADFDSAGISIVAISTETAEQLKSALAKRTEAEGQPRFAILCDPNAQVFRQYRAFDDFESMPMHGTFLIDGAGQVRWQDIGPEPFMDIKFLLGESRRLLALPNE